MPSLEEISQDVSRADVGGQLKDGNSIGWGAINEGLLSADIVPVIVSHLRQLVSENDEGEKSNAPILPILLVNRAFFDAGANVLWENIHGLDPLFKLLPWFDALCGGAQVSEVASGADWNRFNLYASRVRELAFSCRGEEPPLWVRGLGDLALPGMPVPMFPNLRMADISSIDFMSPKTLRIFIPPRLEEFRLAFGWLPQEYEPSDLSPHLAIQIIASTARDLRVLRYQGRIVDQCFFSNLVKLTNLTSVTAYLKGSPGAWAFQCLRELPLLEYLSILLMGSVEAATSREKSMKGLRMDPHTSLTNLRSLEVVFGQYQQCRVAKALSPKNLREAIFAFFRPTDLMPVHLTLGLYLQENPLLEGLEAKFIQPPAQSGIDPEVIPPESRIHWPSEYEATDLFSSTLQKSTNIRRIVVTNIPFHLAISTSRALFNALPCIGSSLVSLRVNLDLQATDRSWGFSAGHGAFPGLSFLATTIWLQCPNLNDLALHFDAELVCHEDLDGSSEGMAKIALFIYHLFPELEVLTGSGVWAPQTWEDVHRLIMTHQHFRDMISNLDLSDP
ncbi:hypothetical protein FA13DRAFT_1731405 [Coprinellus micaceus]|uniref:F-box domain-containing protein n=1 Tax=Coprinellus micaceus TaxID=71717 RepID=A0A4Y7TFD3_COPMI|nr:hypothetical protein FA13DRAFT_1731405 [Coprinellus micaceus]